MNDLTFEQGLDEICVYCRNARQGQALLVLHSASQLDRVLSVLKERCGKEVRSLKVPPRTSVKKLVEKLTAQLNEIPEGSVALLSGWERAYPKGITMRKAFAQLNFYREALFAKPLIQIWAMTQDYSDELALGAPDTFSWFVMVAHLEPQTNSGGFLAVERPLEHDALLPTHRNPFEARRTADWLTAQSKEVLQEGTQEDVPLAIERWAEAVLVLFEADLVEEASDLHQDCERQFSSLWNGRGVLSTLLTQAHHDQYQPRPLSAALRKWGQVMLRLARSQRGLAGLTEAQTALEESLRLIDRKTSPDEWADSQNILGNVLKELGEMTGCDDFTRDAARCYKNVLEVYTRESHPGHWAMTMNNLGNLLSGLGTSKNSAENLKEAADAFRSSLQINSKEAAPEKWATIQNNLGITLQALGERTSSIEVLQQAIDCHIQALTVLSRDVNPIAKADSENNLGIALYSMFKLTGSIETLASSVEALESAVEAYGQSGHILKTAGAKSNLANALALSGTISIDEKSLFRASEAYREAINVYSEASVPVHWAGVQRNLSMILRVLAKLTKNPDSARESVDVARKSVERFSSIGDDENAAATLSHLLESLRLCKELGLDLPPEDSSILEAYDEFVRQAKIQDS